MIQVNQTLNVILFVKILKQINDSIIWKDKQICFKWMKIRISTHKLYYFLISMNLKSKFDNAFGFLDYMQCHLVILNFQFQLASDQPIKSKRNKRQVKFLNQLISRNSIDLESLGVKLLKFSPIISFLIIFLHFTLSLNII